MLIGLDYLKEIAQKLSEKYMKCFILPNGSEDLDFINGFNTCVNLQLPIKYLEWVKTSDYIRIVDEENIPHYAKESEWVDGSFKAIIEQDLFNFWINDVYKI